MRNSMLKRAVAGFAGGALLASGALWVAPAVAAESDDANDETSNEEVFTTQEAEDEARPPLLDPPETVDTYIGQSVQLRKNPNGGPQTSLADFRWVVTQVTAESLNNLDVALPVPMTPAPMLRTLNGNGTDPAQTDAGVVYNFDAVNGAQNKRTLNLWPDDKTIPYDMWAEFSLDGETVTAESVVGKGGVFTATYYLQNNTEEQTTITFENEDGPDTEVEVTSHQPAVGIAKALIPQSWAQFNPGSGLAGADGRGNWQAQWIALPFAPLTKSGVAAFGYTVVIPEGQGFVPEVTVEVAPIYIPPEEEVEEEEAPEEDSGGNPRLEAGLQQASAGAAQLLTGIKGLADSILSGVGTSIDGLVAAVGIAAEAIRDLCAPELLDCGAEDEPSEGLPIEMDELLEIMRSASKLLGDIITCLQEDSGSILPSVCEIIQGQIPSQIAAEIKAINGDLKGAVTNVKLARASMVTTKNLVCKTDPESRECTEATKAVDRIDSAVPELDKATKAFDALAKTVQEGAVTDLVETLQKVKDTLDGVIGLLDNVLELLEKLAPVLAKLSLAVDTLRAGLADGIGKIDTTAAKADISAGGAQLSAGLGTVSAEVKAVISQLLDSLATGGAVLTVVLQRLIAGIDAMILRAGESPLPYGGGTQTLYAPADSDTDVVAASDALLESGATGEYPDGSQEGVQPTTQMFGAYQFMFDPATSDKSNTIWRLLFGLVLMVGAGLLLGRVIANRNNPKPAGDAGGGDTMQMDSVSGPGA